LHILFAGAALLRMEQPLEALGHLPPVRTQRVRTQQSLELTGTPVRAETPFK
jgi:hypothetical protein